MNVLTGKVVLRGVEISGCGQLNTGFSAIDF